MAYKIAIASKDGVYVNAHFRSAPFFSIIQVGDDGNYYEKEKRFPDQEPEEEVCACLQSGKGHSNCNESGKACGGGHSDTVIASRIELISDCRCLLCAKIGPGAKRQLERKAITSFQVNFEIADALQKIMDYYTKIDHHISLRNIRQHEKRSSIQHPVDI